MADLIAFMLPGIILFAIICVFLLIITVIEKIESLKSRKNQVQTNEEADRQTRSIHFTRGDRFINSDSLDLYSEAMKAMGQYNGGSNMDIEILRSDERYRIANMTDKDAVDILRGFLKHGQFMMGRGNGKMIGTLKLIRAMSKGIEALEERNDKK